MKYNWKRDRHDERDHYAHLSPHFKLADAATLPSSVDLRPTCSPVEDQGDLGSCTGNALVGACEYLERKNQAETLANVIRLSRLFVYYNERAIEGTIRSDSGAEIRDGVKSLANQGVCTEADWPYVVSRFRNKPSTAAYTEAVARKITAYARISRTNGLVDFKRALAAGYPVVFGFTCYDSFEGETVEATGVLNMPVAGEAEVGGHAVVAVGYDDASERAIVRNSWGSAWGQHGYFTMPYTYLQSNTLVSDLWTITR
jgi:C1A family cysteine protease